MQATHHCTLHLTPQPNLFGRDADSQLTFRDPAPVFHAGRFPARCQIQTSFSRHRGLGLLRLGMPSLFCLFFCPRSVDEGISWLWMDLHLRNNFLTPTSRPLDLTDVDVCLGNPPPRTAFFTISILFPSPSCTPVKKQTLTHVGSCSSPMQSEKRTLPSMPYLPLISAHSQRPPASFFPFVYPPGPNRPQPLSSAELNTVPLEIYKRKFRS